MNIIFIPLNKLSSYNKFIGKRYNKLIIRRISLAEVCKSNGRFFPLAECDCDCGKEVEARLSSIKSKNTKSCGCLNINHCKTKLADNKVTHGMSKSKEYKAFSNAKERCQNPSKWNYCNYGGRGIEFRFESFEQFINHIGPKPTPKYTLDRKENNGHYEIGNVKWSTVKEQNNNQRKKKNSVH